MMKYLVSAVAALFLLSAPIEAQTGGDTGGISQSGAASGTCSAACNGTTIVGPLDTTGYSTIDLQTTVAGSGSIQTQVSNDGITWTVAACFGAVSNPAPLLNGGVLSFLGTYTCPATGRYFRAQFISYTSGTFTIVGYLRTSLQSVQVSGIVQTFNAPYPVSQAQGPAIPITGNATGTTGAVVGTLAGVANRTTYICGLHVDAVGGTAAIGPVTLAGIVGSSMVFQGASSAAGTGGIPIMNFTPCIPASGINTAITITTTADGTATAVDVNSWGFQL